MKICRNQITERWILGMLGNGESMKLDRMVRCKMISRQDDSETFNIMGNMDLTTIHTDNKRVYVGK